MRKLRKIHLSPFPWGSSRDTAYLSPSSLSLTESTGQPCLNSLNKAQSFLG